MINELKDDNNPFLFKLQYLIDNQIVGYLNYTYLYDRIEIEDLKVEVPYQHQHIASNLMDYLINKATELKAINITLEVNINNLPAINLYKKYNFLQVAIRENYYQTENGILMEKKIGSD